MHINIVLKTLAWLFTTHLHYVLFCVVPDEAQLALPMQKPGFEKLPLGTQTLPPGFPAPFLFADGLSSVETLLTNIQVHIVCVLFTFVRNS